MKFYRSFFLCNAMIILLYSHKELLSKQIITFPPCFKMLFEDALKINPGFRTASYEGNTLLQEITAQLYNNFLVSSPRWSSKPIIPKIIHQIWLGKNENLKAEFYAYRQSIKEKHPEWKYIFWDDAMIKKLTMRNRKIFNNLTSFGAKADIARLEILYQYGGVYLDTDMECLKPLDVFNHVCDFYACLENNLDFIGNAILGCIPQHQIINRCLEEISTRGNSITDDLWQVVLKTGPGMLTRCFLKIAKTNCFHNMRPIIFPPLYFYPLSHLPNIHFEHISPNSYTVHYWAGSWLK